MQNNNTISQYEKMTETPVSKLVMTLSVPTVISMLITNIYNLADTAFVGKLGTSASGATGIVFGLMSIIQAVGFLFGQGSGSIISRLLGSKDTENSSKTASAAFCGTVFFGIIISVFGFIFITPLVRFLGSTETIEPYAKTYVSYILFSAPFMTACFTLNNILRYEGKAAYGMAGLITGALLNICGDAFFMFVLNMGIAGAGLSTALSQIISFIIILSMFLRNKTVCKIRLKYFIPTLPLFMNILTTGLPSLLRQGLNSIATVILNSCAAPFGDEAIAAMSIVNKIIFFVFSIALGIGQGFQPVSGFNYGAKKYSRLKKAFYFTLILSEIVVAVSAVFLMIFPEQLIMIFRDDKAVCDIGKRALILQSLSLFFLPLCTVTEMLFQSTGKKLGASILSTLRSGVFFIPAIIILSEYRGLYGVEEAQPLAFVLSFIPSLMLMIWFFKKIPQNDE